MAKAYHRPLLAFYLAEPPRTEDRGQDFRTLPGHERYHPGIDALVRDIKARQGLIRSMLEDDDAAPVDFIGTATINVPIEALTERIATRLEFSLPQFRAAKGVEEAFSYLRGRIEEAGVFVLLLGNLGSHHTNIPVDLFRGFALADPIAPLIVINDRDARSAWSFTALHELVHLWLGDTGISGTDTDNRIEQYCNDVAGQFLIPARDVLAWTGNANKFEQVVAEITSFADARRVSRPMVAYRLLRDGRISKRLWEDLNAHFTTQWLHYKQEAEKNKAGTGGPSYYVVRRHRVGQALLGLVRRSLDDGTITYTKASRVLGVKPRNVEPLLSTIRRAR
jgi:Zn-dependent peptidase ImmA (M78 family)